MKRIVEAGAHGEGFDDDGWGGELVGIAEVDHWVADYVLR